MEYIKLFEEFDFLKFLKKKPKEEKIQQDEWWLRGKTVEELEIKIGDRMIIKNHYGNHNFDGKTGTITKITSNKRRDPYYIELDEELYGRRGFYMPFECLEKI